jgi:cytidine deaminase
MDREALLAVAREAALHAYAPYSGFRVGAAVVVETADGPRVLTGANIENASFGLTLCAERTALSAACMADGAAQRPDATSRFARPRVTHVAISCIDAPEDAPASLRSPCGACRQWLAELAPDAVYFVDGIPGDLRLPDLLPYAFRLDEPSTPDGLIAHRDLVAPPAPPPATSGTRRRSPGSGGSHSGRGRARSH